MRGAVVIKALALLVAVGALGGVMASGRQLLGAAPSPAASAVDAGPSADGGPRGVSDVFGPGGNVYAPASKSMGSVGIAPQGFGGLGLKGSGSGGGTDDGGSISGRGGIGTGNLSNQGMAYTGPAGVSPGEPTVMGSLDKELIRKTIHAHRGQVRYCFEKQLQVTPKAQGKVVVKFVISPDGTVSKSDVAETTFDPPLPELQDCIAAAVKRLQFPKPKGGGIVIVSYPFVLST